MLSESLKIEAAEAGEAPPTPPASSDEETEDSNGDVVDQQQVQTPPASGDEKSNQSASVPGRSQIDLGFKRVNFCNLSCICFL
jgi:hypothetical protein